jgi:hypothetical protein
VEGMIANPVEAEKRRDSPVKHDLYVMSLNVTSVANRLHPAIMKGSANSKVGRKGIYIGETFPL